MTLSIEVFIEALKIITAVAVYFVWVVRYENIKNSGVNCLNLDFVSFLDKDVSPLTVYFVPRSSEISSISINCFESISAIPDFKSTFTPNTPLYDLILSETVF